MYNLKVVDLVDQLLLLEQQVVPIVVILVKGVGVIHFEERVKPQKKEYAL